MWFWWWTQHMRMQQSRLNPWTQWQQHVSHITRLVGVLEDFLKVMMLSSKRLEGGEAQLPARANTRSLWGRPTITPILYYTGHREQYRSVWEPAVFGGITDTDQYWSILNVTGRVKWKTIHWQNTVLILLDTVQDCASNYWIKLFGVQFCSVLKNTEQYWPNTGRYGRSILGPRT